VAGSGTSATSDVAEATVEQIELILLAEIDVERSGTESSQTLCWRERDSNHRSRIKRRASAWPRVSVRADDVSPLVGITHRQRKPVLVVSRGTDGSNPSPSSEESANFRFRRSGNRIPTFTVILQRNPNAARLATDYNMSVKSLRNRRR
jgi:hypothetical protein